MVALITPIGASPSVWIQAFSKSLPGLEVRVWPDVGDPADIEFAVITKLPAGELAKFPSLRLIVSLFAGQDVLLADPHLPLNIPIVRAGDSDSHGLMVDFIVMHVLRHHCDLPFYQAAQLRSDWVRKERLRVSDRNVGVMGLGSIGLSAAEKLRAYGFNVAGWVRRPRQVSDFEIFAGPSQLSAFLNRSEIVVNVLPLTSQTRDILDEENLRKLPAGAAVINVGRGATVVDEDIIKLLNDQHLAAATLDVFRVEPLPPEHPFWRHPNITVTPHVARNLNIDEIVGKASAFIKKIRAFEDLGICVDRTAGY